MMIVLSPAKSLDYVTAPQTRKHTEPQFIAESAQLIETLRPYSPVQLSELMRLSDKLAALNVARYAEWQPSFSFDNAKQAVLAFNGDVYEGLNATSLKTPDLEFAQKHLRILSGLYGLLRPLDLMQPYRLEMGTRLPNIKGKDLYGFWGTQITEALNVDIAQRKARALINLASEEYFKSVKPKLLLVPVITPVFEEYKNGKYKIISFYAKRARGLMTRYAILNRLKDPTALQAFDSEGYAFDAKASNDFTYVFRRKEPA